MKKLFTKIVTFVLSFCLIGTAGLTVKADSDPNAHEHTGTRSFVEYLDENGNFTTVIWYVCDECDEFVYVSSDTITPKEYYEKEKKNLVPEYQTEEEFNKGMNYQVVDGQVSIDIYGAVVPIWTEEFFSKKTTTLTVPKDYEIMFMNGISGVSDASAKEWAEKYKNEPARITVESDDCSLCYEAGYNNETASTYQTLTLNGEVFEKTGSDFIMEKLPSGNYTITVNDVFLKTSYFAFSNFRMGKPTTGNETFSDYIPEGHVYTHLTWPVDENASNSEEDKENESEDTETKDENTSNEGIAGNTETENLSETTKTEEKSEITLSGVLKDEDGNPIANAVIELHSDPITVKTDNNGYWEIKNPPVGDHVLTAYVAGKTVYQSEIKVSKEKISETVKVKDETVSMSVEAKNTSKVSSPKLGDSKGPGIFVAVTMSCIVLVTLSCYILISKKKKPNKMNIK